MAFLFSDINRCMNRIFIIKRIAETEHGTFGVILDGNTPFAITLENRWYNNEPNISCIPPGTYFCKRVLSPTFGNTFEIMDVQDRTHVLFHWGNRDNDTEGCILIAEEFGVLGGEGAILSSNREGKGFKEFIERTEDINDFMLVIQVFI